jgi:hypothetical protein
MMAGNTSADCGQRFIISLIRRRDEKLISQAIFCHVPRFSQPFLALISSAAIVPASDVELDFARTR